MLKKLMYMLAILIILGMAVPYVGGYIYKRDFVRIIEHVNTDKNTSIRIVDYQLGWFTSHARIVIENNKPRSTDYPTAPAPQITIDQEIKHGPFVYDPGLQRFVFVEALITSQVHIQPYESLLGIATDKGFMQINTVAHYDNTLFSRFSADPFSKDIPNKLRFMWQGFNGTADATIDNYTLQRVNSTMDVGPIGLKINNGAYEFNMLGISVQNTMQASNLPGLWNSTHSDNFKKISYAVGGKEILAIDGITTALHSKVDNNLFGMGLNINVSQFNFTNLIEIKPATLNITVRDLNALAIVKLADLPKAERQSANVFAAMLTPTTNIKSDLTLSSSQGSLFVTADVNWKGQALPTNVNEMRDKTNVQIDVRISQKFLTYLTTLFSPTNANQTNTNNAASDDTAANNNSFAAQITAYINQGYLVADKEDYVSHIVINQGKLTINGKDYTPAPTPTSNTAQPAAAPSIPAQPVGTQLPPTVPAVKPIAPPKVDVPIEGTPFTIEQDPRSQG